MSWRNIKLVFMREVRDQFRDRRTLFMIVVLPLLLYPALGIGMVQMTVLFAEQPRTVVILGAKHLPDQPPLLDDNGIRPLWFSVGRGDATKLRVITDLPLAPDIDDDKLIETREQLLGQAEFIRTRLRELRELESAKTPVDHSEAAAVQSHNHTARILAIRRQISEVFASSSIQVLIVIPDGFGENLDKMNQVLAERGQPSDEVFAYDRPTIIENSADEKSLIAYGRVRDAIHAWEDAILRLRLEAARLPASLHLPVDAERLDLAEDKQLAANVWSKVFPALLVIMAVTGAFYPAIDIGAGEKERGTMETLLICPASRTEIVMGKFFTVMLFSASSAILNLASMGMTGRYMVAIIDSGKNSALGDLSLPPMTSIIWLVVLLLPLAALFSALCLALAAFARSSKEGQYYLTPLLMVTLGLTVFTLSPAVEINPFYSVMPVVNVALLLKGLLLAPVNAAPLYAYVIPVLATSIGYSLLAIWWAIEQFSSEEVLFREAERFDLGLWLRHLLRDKEAIPSFSEAVFCFVLIMFLQFAAIRFMSADLSGPDAGSKMIQLLMMQQVVIIACPAVFMGLILTTDFRRTFRLGLPSAGMMLAAVILPLVLHPLSLALSASLQQWFFPPLPDSVVRVLQSMNDPNLPLPLLLLAFAGAPAVCEELAFRGLILSGFWSRQRTLIAIGLSSLAFGIMHLIPQQVFNAALLGMVLGLLALRSNSLFPCITFHFVYNSLAVLRERCGSTMNPAGPLGLLFKVDDAQLQYRPALLVICGVVAFMTIRWLIKQDNPARMQRTADDAPGMSSVAPA